MSQNGFAEPGLVKQVLEVLDLESEVSEKAKALVALGERARNESPVEQVPWTRVGKLDTRTAVSVLVGFLQEEQAKGESVEGMQSLVRVLEAKHPTLLHSDGSQSETSAPVLGIPPLGEQPAAGTERHWNSSVEARQVATLLRTFDSSLVKELKENAQHEVFKPEWSLRGKTGNANLFWSTLKQSLAGPERQLSVVEGSEESKGKSGASSTMKYKEPPALTLEQIQKKGLRGLRAYESDILLRCQSAGKDETAISKAFANSLSFELRTIVARAHDNANLAELPVEQMVTALVEAFNLDQGSITYEAFLKFKQKPGMNVTTFLNELQSKWELIRTSKDKKLAPYIVSAHGDAVVLDQVRKGLIPELHARAHLTSVTKCKKGLDDITTVTEMRRCLLEAERQLLQEGGLQKPRGDILAVVTNTTDSIPPSQPKTQEQAPGKKKPNYGPRYGSRYHRHGNRTHPQHSGPSAKWDSMNRGARLKFMGLRGQTCTAKERAEYRRGKASLKLCQAIWRFCGATGANPYTLRIEDDVNKRSREFNTEYDKWQEERKAALLEGQQE